jgi:hypothetical protein
MVSDEYVDLVLQVAAREQTIAAMLRDICGLPPATRRTALDVVGAHLRSHDARGDVLACVEALRHDDVARRIVDRLARGG